MNTTTRRQLLKLTSGIALTGTLAGCTTTQEPDETTQTLLSNSTLITSPSCDCCDEYKDHLQDNGIKNITTEKIDDHTEIKQNANIPQEYWSCHTIQTDDYLIEGHVPLEAIEKLANEQPDIKGIGLPGMPAGSPGMGGIKQEDFEIYAIQHNGNLTHYMSL